MLFAENIFIINYFLYFQIIIYYLCIIFQIVCIFCELPSLFSSVYPFSIRPSQV